MPRLWPKRSPLIEDLPRVFLGVAYILKFPVAELLRGIDIFPTALLHQLVDRLLLATASNEPS